MKKLNLCIVLLSRVLLCIAIFFLSFVFVPTIAAQSTCGNDIIEGVEECDDGNTLDGDCCSAECTFEPFGTPCGDPSDTECTNPDICTGDGYCSPQHFPGGTPCGDQGVECLADDTCSGDGRCIDNGFEPFGTPCGDPSDTECTNPDICTGNGYCSPQHSPGGTPCTDDGNICTDDECSGGGVCFHINNTLLCDDGLYCNGTDSCSGGTCSVHAGDPCGPLFCDEGFDVCESDTMCKGNFDYDQDVDGADAFTFKEHFGRNQYVDPCPPDGPAPVEKTWQGTSIVDYDDGYYQKGVVWPLPRFTDNSDGTVTDNLTGLIWLKDSNCMATHYPEIDNEHIIGDGGVSWQPAFNFVAGINDGTYPLCGAGYTDWRIPNNKELLSLIDYGYYGPALCNTVGTGQWSEGDPFTNNAYGGFSSTTIGDREDLVYLLTTQEGRMLLVPKEGNFSLVWPVRGGH